jgi:hypothetical protein
MKSTHRFNHPKWRRVQTDRDVPTESHSSGRLVGIPRCSQLHAHLYDIQGVRAKSLSSPVPESYFGVQSGRIPNPKLALNSLCLKRLADINHVYP